MPWENISSRCITGKHEFVAANQLLVCQDEVQSFVATKSPAFSVMLYCGYITSVPFPIGEASVNAPLIAATSGGGDGLAAKNWYIMDKSLSDVTASDSVNGPAIPDMTGCLPMGRATEIDPTSGTSTNRVTPSFNQSYGTIDISNGIAPGHTHVTTWDGSNANLYLDLRHFHTLPSIYTAGNSTSFTSSPQQKGTGCMNAFEINEGQPSAVDPSHSIVYAMKKDETGTQPDGVVAGGGSWNSNDGLGLSLSDAGTLGPTKQTGDLSTQPTPINDPANAGATSEPLYARSYYSYTNPADGTDAWSSSTPQGWGESDIIDNSNSLFIQNLGGDVPAIDSEAYYCTTPSDGLGINPLVMTDGSEPESAPEIDITKNGYKCFGMYYIIYYPTNIT